MAASTCAFTPSAAASADSARDFEAAWKAARASYWLGTRGPERERRAALERGIKAGELAVAIDASSGKTLWNTQGREGENASILGSPSWLLASTTDGNLVIARASPQKYDEVRRYQVSDSAMWAHPAIAQGSIVTKGVDKVVCWRW